ncbi:MULTISPECIES: peptidoglycan-binding domain-containing protein [Crocosphaera]|nr:peptidoglycan-binding domain-containing protein [Crocosphaera sp.]MCH2244961.1 peptidoglycan-binding protein [Crocosphaera sp.]
MRNAGDDVDDIYGPKTEAAVRQFQTDQGIMIDGVVGPETYGQLGID